MGPTLYLRLLLLLLLLVLGLMLYLLRGRRELGCGAQYGVIRGMFVWRELQ